VFNVSPRSIESIGGFDEELTVAYNDVDLCLKMLEKGYRNIYLPHVVLYHHESKSRGYEDSPEKKDRLRKESKLMESRWQKYIANDPYYSPHLTRACQDSGIRLGGRELAAESLGTSLGV
jgi:GT2 family glycosyltransferase